jgi:hypothetical protein
MKTRDVDFCEEEERKEKKSTCLEGNEERSFDRRSLARGIGAAAATALLPSRLRADDAPVPLSKESSGAPVDSLIDAALAVSPAELSPEQRLDVRNGVRSLQQALADARKAKLDYGVEPAFIFLAEGKR